MRPLEIVDDSLKDSTELVGGAESPLEVLEELRLTLDSFMRKDVLAALWEIKQELNKEPRHSEIYSYFKRASLDGEQCKFAIKALKGFEQYRMDRTKELLIRALEALDGR